MDPKMDSGVLAEGESLDEEYDVSRDLLPEEILGIIDQLLCLEVGSRSIDISYKTSGLGYPRSDLGIPIRWPGILVTPFHRLYSRVST